MQIIISGKGVDLTDAIEAYVNKKMNGLTKFFEGIIRADVVLGKSSRHHNKGEVFFAECKLEVPGNDLFARHDATSVYESLDFLRDHLGQELKKYKTRLNSDKKKKQRSVRAGKEYQAQEDY